MTEGENYTNNIGDEPELLGSESPPISTRESPTSESEDDSNPETKELKLKGEETKQYLISVDGEGFGYCRTLEDARVKLWRVAREMCMEHFVDFRTMIEMTTHPSKLKVVGIYRWGIFSTTTLLHTVEIQCVYEYQED